MDDDTASYLHESLIKMGIEEMKMMDKGGPTIISTKKAGGREARRWITILNEIVNCSFKFQGGGGGSGDNNNKTMTMVSTSSSCSTSEDSGHFDQNNTKEKGTLSSTSSSASAPGGLLRKYMVILQDCVVIKFIKRSSSCEGLLTDDSCEEDQKEQDLNKEGFKLFKSLKEANLKCYWNSTLCEAINNLEYKGYLVPSTIIVFSKEQFHLVTVITAWARKMLRSPIGYKIDFVGEIEELVGEPVPQSQFAPLSDSLCWAILELTSTGEEAFVEGILRKLRDTFPLMTPPPRELVYQTLERLIKDRKIYQTSRGYFIVTPDTYRYISASEGGMAGMGGMGSSSSAIATLDALTSSYYYIDEDKLSHYGSINGVQLRRHNSLKVIRQRDLELPAPVASTLSLGNAAASSFHRDRLAKTQSMIENTNGNDIRRPMEQRIEDGRRVITLPPSGKENSSKKSSFFQRLFSFRRSKKVNNKGKGPLPPNLPTTRKQEQQHSSYFCHTTSKPSTAVPTVPSTIPQNICKNW